MTQQLFDLGSTASVCSPHGSGKVRGLVAVGKLANSNADMAPRFGVGERLGAT